MIFFPPSIVFMAQFHRFLWFYPCPTLGHFNQDGLEKMVDALRQALRGAEEQNGRMQEIRRASGTCLGLGLGVLRDWTLELSLDFFIYEHCDNGMCIHIVYIIIYILCKHRVLNCYRQLLVDGDSTTRHGNLNTQWIDIELQRWGENLE